MRNTEAPLDRLSQCQVKLRCLYCLDFRDLGSMNGGADGIGFILRDLADDLKEIEEELWAEKKSANTKDEPSKV